MGERIDYREGRWVVPDCPTIPFIEGDGTGPDIWRAARRVFDAAVAKAPGGRRRGGELAPRSDAGDDPAVPSGDQGPSHDARRGRDPLAQRGAAPDPRSLRVCAAGTLLRGRAESDAGAPEAERRD